jgi:hypothetical protein
LDGLKYAHQHGCYLGGNSASAAAESGNIACLKYIIENIPFRGSDILLMALTSGNMECVRYVWEQCDVSECVSDHLNLLASYAVMGGNLDCLEFAINTGSELNDTCIYNAVYGNHFECFKYLVEHFDAQKAYVVASEHGNLEFMQYAFDSAQVCDSDAIAKAIKNGHYDCALYAIECGSLIPDEYAKLLDFVRLYPGAL